MYSILSISISLKYTSLSDAAFPAISRASTAKYFSQSARVHGNLKHTGQTKLDRQAKADRQMDTLTEPPCSVVLTTEEEQHPGLCVDGE